MRRTALQDVQAAMVTYGRAVNTTPEKALLDEIRRTAGHVEWLGDKVAQLQSAELVYGVQSVTQKTTGPDGGWGASGVETTVRAGVAINIWLELYMKERAHLGQMCALAIRAGIEERRVRAAEKMADVWGTAVTMLLQDLGHDPADPVIREKARKRMLEAASVA